MNPFPIFAIMQISPKAFVIEFKFNLNCFLDAELKIDLI